MAAEARTAPNSRGTPGEKRMMGFYVWLALSVLLVVYLVVAISYTRVQIQYQLNYSVYGFMVLMGLALSAVSLGLFVRGFSRNKLLEVIQSSERESRLEGSQRAKEMAQIYQHWFLTNSICWSLNQGVGMLGLFYAFASRSFMLSLPFFVVSLVLNFFMYPRFASLKQRAGLGHQ